MLEELLTAPKVIKSIQRGVCSPTVDGAVISISLVDVDKTAVIINGNNMYYSGTNARERGAIGIYLKELTSTTLTVCAGMAVGYDGTICNCSWQVVEFC